MTDRWDDGGTDADADRLTDVQRTRSGRSFFPDNKGGYGPVGQSRTIEQGGARRPSPPSDVPLKANAKTSLVAAIWMAPLLDRPIRNLTLLCHHATLCMPRMERNGKKIECLDKKIGSSTLGKSNKLSTFYLL